jgi:hypothetical protein
MPKVRFFLPFFLALMVLLDIRLGWAQEEDYYNSTELRYDDFVYVANLKTVRLYKEGNEFSYPIVNLGKGEHLVLDFDDLDADYKNYYFTFVHCTADWQPTDMSQMNYIGPFQNDQIVSYDFSLNTIQKYTHYRTVFPNNNIKFKKSGNYLLTVYKDDPENIVISRRFYVWEEKMTVGGSLHRSTIIEQRDSHQELDFFISYPASYNVTNVWDIKTVIFQNYRLDNAITTLKPMFVNQNKLEYNYDTDNSFEGGSEYRVFDLKTIRFNSFNVAHIDWQGKQVEAWLNVDRPRSSLRYDFYNDLNGMYYIARQEGGDPTIECDYVVVHFALDDKEPRKDGNYYVFGGISDWQLKPEFRMTYNDVLLRYECAPFVKQGLYNYQYVFVPDKKKEIDASLVEGSHFETNNTYTILVYNQEPGIPYDRLVGVGFFNPLDYVLNR